VTAIKFSSFADDDYGESVEEDSEPPEYQFSIKTPVRKITGFVVER
jgi:hypothetical protein